MISPGRPLLTFAILVVIVLLISPPDGILSENEENYFGLAAQSLTPLTGSSDSALFDTSHHRVLNEFLLGHLIAAVGFEWAQMIARGIAAGLGAWALSRLVRGLKVRVDDAALAVMGFAVVGQTLFGGEWLFRGYESKVAAYILVLFGLYPVITRGNLRWGAAAAFLAATYFHFQVGGFWLVAALLYIAAAGQFSRETLTGLTVYAVGTLPLLFLIMTDRLQDGAPVAAAMPSADMIYSLLRAPNHVAPFRSWSWFLGKWLPGLVAAALMLAGARGIARRTRTPELCRLANWLTWLLSYLLLAVAVSFFDRGTGTLGKFYLFRPGSLVLLLWLVLVAARAREWTVGTAAVWLRPLLAVVIVPSFLIGSIGEIRDHIAQRNETETEKAPLFDAIARLTGPQDVVLIDPLLEYDYGDFERRTARATLVNWKFDNTRNQDIIEWDRRMRSRAALFDRGCGGPLTRRVNFLLVSPQQTDGLVQSCGPIVYRDVKATLIKVRHMGRRRPGGNKHKADLSASRIGKTAHHQPSRPAPIRP